MSPIKAAVCWALGVDERATWRMFLDLASVSRIGSRAGDVPFLASYNEVTDRTAVEPVSDRSERDRPARRERRGAAGVDDEAAFARAFGHRHAERFEQRVVLFRRAPGGRQVVADDQRVGAREQAHRLELAEDAFAPAGQAQPRRGQDEPEQRDRLQRLARGERRLPVERRSRTRVEQVDRDLARFQLGELEREVDALLEGLAHAEDAAAAELHARIAGEAGGADAVVVAVGRADRSGTARGTLRGCGCNGARRRPRDGRPVRVSASRASTRLRGRSRAAPRRPRRSRVGATALPGRAPRRRCRTGWRRRHESRARPRGSRRCRGTGRRRHPSGGGPTANRTRSLRGRRRTWR